MKIVKQILAGAIVIALMLFFSIFLIAAISCLYPGYMEKCFDVIRVPY